MKKVACMVEVITRRKGCIEKRSIVHTHRVPEFIKPKKYRARHNPAQDLQHLTPKGFHFEGVGLTVKAIV